MGLWQRNRSLVSSAKFSKATTNLADTKKSVAADDKDNQCAHHEKSYSMHTCEQNIKKISEALMSSKRASLEVLTLIDDIQRLGIEYYFKEEIKSALDRQYMKLCFARGRSTDLHETALRFRLLRQEGYDMPADSFDKFKNENGKFRPELGKDIQGLMSLYEASEMRVEAEDTLGEAYEYSRQVLDAVMENHQHQPLVKIVGNTLKHPHHKSLPKFTAENSLCNFNDKKRMRKELRDLANMDFIMAKAMYREEMRQVSCWWDNLGLAKEMKFARNQPLKWYMWPVAAIPDPSMSEMRTEIVKTIAMIYIIDDLFDVYGTLDDLSIFTEAVNRWDFTMVEVLPNCMRACFKALYDITDGIGHHIYERHGMNPRYLMRKMWANLCNAFLVEARWFNTGHVPNTDDYLKNGIISTGVHVVLAHLFFLMGEDACDNKMDVSNGFPSIMDNIATILRLWDDLGSAKDENQDGKDGSFVECYLNENKGSSVDDAREHVKKMISDAWKRLNEDYLTQYPFSLPLKKICLNFARMVPLMYNYDDNYSLPILKKHMKTFLSQDTQNPNQD